MLVLDSFGNGHRCRRADDGHANGCSDDTAGVETIHNQPRRFVGAKGCAEVVMAAGWAWTWLMLFVHGFF